MKYFGTDLEFLATSTAEFGDSFNICEAFGAFHFPEWRIVRPGLWKGLALSTFGVLFTTFLVGCFVTFVFHFSLPEGLLLGAIVSSTDAAAIFAVLRSKKLGPKGFLKPLVELESGRNDPMAVFLTIGFIHLLTKPGSSMLDPFPMFLKQMTLGAAFGYGIGRGIIFTINRLKLEYEGLYPVLTLSLILLTYGATTSLGGNGFLAVYLAGLVMGNSNFIHKKSLIRFHDGLAWLMQIAMFLTLGLLVFPSRLVPVIGGSILISAFLMFFARPISVMATLFFAKMSLREKTMVSWLGLRGAVPIILATFPLLAGLPRADTIFNIVFFIVLTSVLLQGTSITLVAKWLKVDLPISTKPQYPLEFMPACDLKSELVEMTVPHQTVVVGKQIGELGLPQGVLFVLISRGEECFILNGGTILNADDQILVLAHKKDIPAIRSLTESRQNPEK